MTSLDDIYPTTMQYQPHRDADWRVVESSSEYISRMQQGLLRHWPAEVIREWLHRLKTEKCIVLHDSQKYGGELTRIPGREAFRDESFCDRFQNMEVRAADGQHDWLAHYMLKEGAWNTPIVHLDNPGPVPIWRMKEIKTPYHLLESHRRLSFLQGLKRLGQARSVHLL